MREEVARNPLLSRPVLKIGCIALPLPLLVLLRWCEVKTRTRYFLLQIPGWVLAAILLGMLHRWFSLPWWAAVAGWILFFIKDCVLYPYLKKAYETESPSGADRLVGELGTVTRTLQPDGYIRIGGELWQARVQDDSGKVPIGSKVRVLKAEGILLIVEEITPK